MAALISRTNDIAIAEIVPTISTLIYTAGDCIGGKLTLANASKAAGGGGFIQSIGLVDLAVQDADLDLIFFDADPDTSTLTDQAAFDIADADMAKILPGGWLSLFAGDYKAGADNSIAALRNLTIPFVTEASADLFVAIIARATPTYDAITDLVLRVGIVRA